MKQQVTIWCQYSGSRSDLEDLRNKSLQGIEISRWPAEFLGQRSYSECLDLAAVVLPKKGVEKGVFVLAITFDQLREG